MERLTKQKVEEHDPKDDFEREDVPVEEWGFIVEVRGMAVGEVQKIEKLLKTGEFNKNPIAHMIDVILNCAIPFDTAAEIAKFDYRGIVPLARGILEFSGMNFLSKSSSVEAPDDEDLEEIRAMIEEGGEDVEEQVNEFLEEAKGNSETTPS